MTALRIDRSIADPAAEEMRRRRAALVAAAHSALPGPLDVQLARIDDRARVDVSRWDDLATARSAVRAAPAVPEAVASALFEVAVEFAEAVDV